MADNEIQIDLELTTKTFEAALASAAKAAEAFATSLNKQLAGSQDALNDVGKAGADAGNKIKKAGNEATAAWETFKGVLGAEAAIAALIFIKDAATVLFQTFIVDGVKAASEAESALQRLKSSLLVSGDAANGTLENFQAFAQQLKKTTTVDDDAVISQLALAKQYGLTNEQAKEVVKVAVDMAAKGYDLGTSTKQLSESFSGYAGRLVKTNPLLRDFTVEMNQAGATVKLLGAQFAGAGTDKVLTFAGSVEQANKEFNDLQKEIGAIIIKNPAVISAIQQVGAVFLQLTAYVEANKETLIDFTTNGVTKLVAAITAVVTTGQDFIQFLRENATELEAIGVGLAVATSAYLAYSLAVNASAIAAGLATVAQAALNLVLTANPVGLVIVAVGLLAAGLYYLVVNIDLVQAAFLGMAAGMLTDVLPAIQATLETIGKVAAVFDEDLAASINGAVDSVQETIDTLNALQEQALSDAKDKDVAAKQKEQADIDAANAAKIASKTQTDATLAGQDQTSNADKLATLSATLAAQAAAEKAAEEQRKLDEKAAADARKAAEAKFRQELEAERRAARTTHLKDEADYLKELDAREDQSLRDRFQSEKSFSESLRDEQRDRVSFELATDQQRVAGVKGTLGDIAALQSSSNQELFAVGKAAAIAQATISSYQAVVNALAQVPYPFNIAAAAAVGIAGALQISKIASTQPPPKSAGSFATGGIVPGSSFSGDKLQANVNSGEGIFTVAQQKRLFNIANGTDAANGSGDLGQKVDALASAIMSQPVYVTLDGEVVAMAVRSQVRGGFDLGVA